MLKNPKTIEDRINRILDAWERLAPAQTFGGMTLDEAKGKTKGSLELREEIATLQTQLTARISDRDDADKESLRALDLVVKSVVGDVAYGDDSALYEAMGYIRKSERKRGLTRKRHAQTESSPTEG